MKWIVTGADRVTGDDKMHEVEAITEAEVRRVYGRSMLISEVRPANMAAPSAPAAAFAATAAPTAATPARKPPEYASITTGATVLRLIGFLAILVGAVGLAAGLMGSTGGKSDPSLAMLPPASCIIGGGGAILYGVMAMFVAGLGEAVRDIARNSFNR